MADYRKLLWGGILLSICHACLTNQPAIRYTQTPAIAGAEIAVTDTTNFGDTLFLVKAQDNTPLYYFQDIQTGVCFDGKCRALSLTVLWNITGRYLGFQLPKDEFLSKTYHEPFTPAEYERLHGLLANPDLPLSAVSYDELMENTETNDPEIDGTSGATSQAVAAMVVEGAAYTTYKLWNIVYGSTRAQIMALTAQQLTPKLLEEILKSPDQTDKIWALEHIHEKLEFTPTLIETMAGLLATDDFSLAYAVIRAISKGHLANGQLQAQLFGQYENAAPSIRSLLIKKLMDAPNLSHEVVKASGNLLEQVNGKELGDFLKLYAAHGVDDKDILNKLRKLANHENAYIANQARGFLDEVGK